MTAPVIPLPRREQSPCQQVVDQVATRRDGFLALYENRIMHELDRQASLFYPDETGNLSRTDPNQLSFEGLKEVPPPNVDPTTGEITDSKETHA